MSEQNVDYVGRLASGELGRLVTARHGFWCNSRHHQTAACIKSDALDALWALIGDAPRGRFWKARQVGKATDIRLLAARRGAKA